MGLTWGRPRRAVIDLVPACGGSRRGGSHPGDCQGCKLSLRTRRSDSRCVEKTLKQAKAVAGRGPKTSRGLTDPYHAQLWIVGDAIGDACWRKGHAAGIRRKAPAEGKIRADFSLNELLQLSWLAHLRVQYMMPNYRGFEIHRFGGEEDALEGAIAIGKIEGAIPAKMRPFTDLGVQLKNRQKLINDWWQGVPDRLTA